MSDFSVDEGINEIPHFAFPHIPAMTKFAERKCLNTVHIQYTTVCRMRIWLTVVTVLSVEWSLAFLLTSNVVLPDDVILYFLCWLDPPVFWPLNKKRKVRKKKNKENMKTAVSYTVDSRPKGGTKQKWNSARKKKMYINCFEWAVG